MADLVQLSEALQKMDIAGVKRLTEEAIAGGIDPQKILSDGLIAGMAVVGEKFKTHEIFLPMSSQAHFARLHQCAGCEHVVAAEDCGGSGVTGHQAFKRCGPFFDRVFCLFNLQLFGVEPMVADCLAYSVKPTARTVISHPVRRDHGNMAMTHLKHLIGERLHGPAIVQADRQSLRCAIE